MSAARNRPKGRRPKLDDVMIARICGQIKKANTIRTAVVACGIGQATYYEWKAKGEDDRKAYQDWKASPDTWEGPKPPERTKHTDFLDAIEHADAVAQQRLVAGVLNNAPWKAKMEILKRRWPKEFGDKTALTNPDGSPLAMGGGGGINVSFKFDQPSNDDPFVWDPSTGKGPNGEDLPPEEPPAGPPAP